MRLIHARQHPNQLPTNTCQAPKATPASGAIRRRISRTINLHSASSPRNHRATQAQHPNQQPRRNLPIPLAVSRTAGATQTLATHPGKHPAQAHPNHPAQRFNQPQQCHGADALAIPAPASKPSRLEWRLASHRVSCCQSQPALRLASSNQSLVPAPSQHPVRLPGLPPGMHAHVPGRDDYRAPCS